MTGARDPADIRRSLLDMKIKQRLAEKAERERIVPVPRGGKLAIAEQQRYLWFLNQLAPDTPMYNVPFAWRLRGALDITGLAGALCGVVARNESLRSRFGDEHGVPYQVIDAAPEQWPLPVHGGTEETIADWIEAGVRTPFDLETGPLFRSSLLRMADDDHVLLLVWHHIVTDGWSARLFLEEMATRYAAGLSGTAVTLPDLVVQPADYAAWQRRWLLGDDPAKQVDYWRDTLAGLESLELPTDRPRPVQPTGVGAILDAELSKELCHGLRELARIEGVSLLAVLLAGFQVVLGRYTGQRDVTLGSVMSGRTRSEVEPLIGMFANMVVVRGNIAANQTFREARPPMS